MANKFTEQRKKRNSANATEEFVEKLYEDEEVINEHIKDNDKDNREQNEEPVKRRPGRPKLEDREASSVYSILLADSIREKMSLAARARRISVKKYIVKLIEDDYNNNSDKYEAFRELSEKLGF